MKQRTDNRIQAQRLGVAGEQTARAFLAQKGMLLIDAGWRCRLGELDLVMLDRDTLVFVEVRARSADSMVSAIDSIDTHKQKRFVRAARAWLAAHPTESELPARFDVVAITGEELHWFPDAFSVQAY